MISSCSLFSHNYVDDTQVACQSLYEDMGEKILGNQLLAELIEKFIPSSQPTQQAGSIDEYGESVITLVNREIAYFPLSFTRQFNEKGELESQDVFFILDAAYKRNVFLVIFANKQGYNYENAISSLDLVNKTYQELSSFFSKSENKLRNLIYEKGDGRPLTVVPKNEIMSWVSPRGTFSVNHTVEKE